MPPPDIIFRPPPEPVKRPTQDKGEDQVAPAKKPATEEAVRHSGGNSNVSPLGDHQQPTTSKSNNCQAQPFTTRSAHETLYCFGMNEDGQLGLPSDIEEQEFPSLVETLKDKKIIDVACGGMHTLALEKNGTVWSFGSNDDQALGRRTEEEEDNFKPGKVCLPEGVKVKQISAGDSHSAALTVNGDAYVWGCFHLSSGKKIGLVRDGGEIGRLKPVNITADLKVKITKIASGADHLVMLSENGRVYTCGTCEKGQLGRKHPGPRRITRSMGLNAQSEISNEEYLLKPAIVKMGRNRRIVDIWTGEYSTYCRANNNEIYVFGVNKWSQLGIPNANDENGVIPEPTKNTNFKGKQWLQIAGGLDHTVALDTDGKVYTLGRKDDGRLGIQGDDRTRFIDEPTLVPRLASIKCKQVGAGASTSYAITNEGHLYSWGFGVNSQLGTGEDRDYEDQPKRCRRAPDTPLEGVVRVDAGGQHVAVTVSN